jgi:MoxR-like ATPase
LLRVRLGYPALIDEIHILEQQQLRHPITTLEAVVTPDEVQQAQEAIKTVFVSDAVKRYIVDLIRATRESNDVYLGSSPRGSLGLYRVGQARAAMHGRDFVLPDDVKVLAEQVLSHRMIVDPAARLRNISGDLIVQEILRSLPVPGGQVKR